MKDFRDMDGKFNMIEEKIIHKDAFPVRARTVDNLKRNQFLFYFYY